MGATGVLAAGALSVPELTGSPMGVRHSAALSGFGASGDVYKELGVTTVINGQGTMTVLGGSLIRPEVRR